MAYLDADLFVVHSLVKSLYQHLHALVAFMHALYHYSVLHLFYRKCCLPTFTLELVALITYVTKIPCSLGAADNIMYTL